MKQCSKCHRKKSLDNFAVSKASKDGRQAYCKACVTQIMVARYRQNPNPFRESSAVLRDRVASEINAIKALTGCQLCGEKEPICLDFHHTDEKEKSVSYWVRAKSLSKALKEIEQCICVCANCHRKIHAGLITAPKLI